MELNWKHICLDMSVVDIQNFIRKNNHKLSEVQKLMLNTRISEMREANKIFAEKLIQSKIFYLAVKEIGRKNREIQDVSPADLVSDDKMFFQYKNDVIDNMVKIRDYSIAQVQSKNMLKKRWNKSKR